MIPLRPPPQISSPHPVERRNDSWLRPGPALFCYYWLRSDRCNAPRRLSPRTIPPSPADQSASSQPSPWPRVQGSARQRAIQLHKPAPPDELTYAEPCPTVSTQKCCRRQWQWETSTTAP